MVEAGVEIRTVAFLNGAMTLREARELLCRTSGKEKTLIHLIINRKPFPIIRWFITTNGLATVLRAGDQVCLDCGSTKTEQEISVGQIGQRLVWFCCQCDLEIVSVFRVKNGIRSLLKHREDPVRWCSSVGLTNMERA